MVINGRILHILLELLLSLQYTEGEKDLHSLDSIFSPWFFIWNLLSGPVSGLSPFFSCMILILIVNTARILLYMFLAIVCPLVCVHIYTVIPK